MSSYIERSRTEQANELIQAIATCGRKFFAHAGEVSRMEIDDRGRVWFVDSYSKKRIYTHYRYNWRGFTNGGTLRDLIERLRDFIKTGKQVPRSRFWSNPAIIPNGDRWGYGSDMAIVQQAAVHLGIVPENEQGK